MKGIFTCVIAFISSIALAQNLTGVESVEYDPISQRFFVTNGSNIVIIDENEDPNGTLASGAGANYGMEVVNGVLWAISNNQVKGYNLGDGSLLSTVNIAGASFLNGMASDGVSRLWVTDFSLKKIHEIDVSDLGAPTTTVLVANTVSTPNGIVYDGENNRLVFVNWGSNAAIKQVDLTTGSVSTITSTNLGNCDGIDNDSYGNYYVSSWSPTRITRFNNDFTANEIITITGLSSPADICYAQEIDTLAIPNSGNQTVRLVGFDFSSSVGEWNEEAGVAIYPNPVKDWTTLSFFNKASEQLAISIVDAQGRLVREIIHASFPMGLQRVMMDCSELSAGQFMCVVQSSTQKLAVPFLVER
jgi:hypothetical protein